MTEFQAFVDGEPEPNLFDVDPIEDTANPFADFCVLKIDDTGGEKFAKYGRGTRIDVDILPEPEQELTVESGDTFETSSGDTDTFTTVQNAGTYQNAGTVQSTGEERIQKFTGFVVERRELDQDGADVLEIEAYTFDQFLRKAEVKSDLEGLSIADALEAIIDEISAVSFNADLIDVGDEQTLTRSYRGDPVETAIRDLAFKSVNEEFGVNADLEFFFRPRETTHIDRGVDNTQWFNYDIPELGKEAINEVEVFFDDGDRSVVVDNGTDKLDLQDGLDLPGPGTQKAEINRKEITNSEDAESEGRKFLEFRNATLTGTVTTFGLFDAEPGDTINIEIDERGIDDEFVIAGLKYTWGVDETRLTIVENRGENNAEFLFRINESLKRLELEDVDRDGPQDRITSTNVATRIDLSADIDGTPNDRERFVNTGRNLVRDGWRGDSVTIDTLAVGTSNSGLSRSNTELREQVATESVSTTLDGDTGVTFDATFSETDIQEVGLFDGDTLVTRLTTDEPVDADGSVSVSFDVDDDTDVSRGVITDAGQQAIRDVLADNSPTLPDTYAFGSDITEPQTTDVELGDELVELSLDEILIQEADTNDTWDSITPEFEDTDIVRVVDGELKTTQICFFREGEDNDRGRTGFDDGSSDNNISGDDYISLSRDEDAGGVDPPDRAEWDFTVDHTIPAEHFEIYIRHSANDEGVPEHNWILQHDNGTDYTLDSNDILGAGIGDFSWRKLPFWSDPAPEDVDADLEAGTTHTLRVEITDSDGQADVYQYWIDCVAPIDGRFESELNFDETTDANDALEGPSKFTEQQIVALDTASTRRDVTQANFESVWNNTDNEQYVELANDGETFERLNNADSGIAQFAEPDNSVDTNLSISNFADNPTNTPSEGDSTQAVDVWDLFADPDAITPETIGVATVRAITTAGQLENQTVQEGGQKSDGTLLTRSIFPDFDVGEQTTLISAERIEFKT